MMSGMFFVLYLFTRLIGRVSDLWRRTPGVYLNGKEVWDGGGRQQTDLSLQWKGTENTADHPKVELASPKEECKTICDVGQMEVKLSESPRCSGHTDRDTVVNEVQGQSDDPFNPFIQEVGTSTADTHSQTEGLTGWHDLEMERNVHVYLGYDSDAGHVPMGSPVFDLAALLADAQQVPVAMEPIGWHFPVGLGLSQMCYCPYVQFPEVSYYPAFKENDNIEVMWRVWEDLSETNSDVSSDTSAVFDFTIMSYNILAQDLLSANPDLYTHCPEDMLLWENRLQIILKELQYWRPDIICLQEAQKDHFYQQIHPLLTVMGYTCIYKRRTGSKTDGCAVCFRSERFTQMSVSLLEFCRTDCELLDRDNVGIVLLLQPMTGQDTVLRPLCVANTHLLFNPRRGDVKLAQLSVLLAEIDLVVNKCRSEGTDCEVILCGDFNALPSSPLWTFITSGQLYYHGLPNWMVSCQKDLSYKVHHTRLFAPLWPSSLGITDCCQYNRDTPTAAPDKKRYSHEFMCQLRFCEAACVRPADLVLIPGVTDKTPDADDKKMFNPSFGYTLRHTLKLTSAYSAVHLEAQTDLVSSLNAEGGAMVDYIFYSPQRNTDGAEGSVSGLRLLGRLSLLSEADLWALRGLPNEHFPSDHLSLLVKLRLA